VLLRGRWEPEGKWAIVMEPSKANRRVRRGRLVVGLVLSLLAAGLVVGAYLYERYSYGVAVGYQMPSLAAAVHVYYEREQALPDSMDAIRAFGLYGVGAYRLPANGWEGWNEHSGPEVLYLPIGNWDGNTPYVIAVQPPLKRRRSNTRLYLVLGEMGPRQTTEEGLTEVLSRDDDIRARNGQPGRWDDMDWRSRQ
jgi:hypothetical protein